jgi:hypothetical protein
MEEEEAVDGFVGDRRRRRRRRRGASANLERSLPVGHAKRRRRCKNDVTTNLMIRRYICLVDEMSLSSKLSCRRYVTFC